ncbi:MAG: hypothetical protein ACFHU9_02405 [Fluviicola sp.]
MQKTAILIFSLTFSCLAMAQKAIVIDNTKENSALFDQKDPLSLASLLKENDYYLGYMDISGMNTKLFDALSEDDKQQAAMFIGEPGTVPLTVTDPGAPNFGEILLVTNPETGMQSFVYEAPDTIYTFLSDFDRIVIELEEGEKPTMENASRITFYRELDGVFSEVLGVNAQDLFTFDGFNHIRKLDEELTTELLKNESNSLWNSMRNEALRQREMYDGSHFGKWRYKLKNYYFPADGISMGFLRFSEEPQNLQKWYDEREVFYLNLSIEAEEERYPFGMSYGSGVKNDTAALARFLANFDEVFSEIEIPTAPLKEKDPSSPNFGKVLKVDNEDGTQSILYPDPKEVFFWLDCSDVGIYVNESFHMESGTIETTPDALYFTAVIDGKEEVISAVPFSESVAPYFSNYEPVSMQEMGSYKAIEQVFKNKNLVYDLNDPNVLQELKLN